MTGPWRRLGARARALFRRDAAERDLDDELRFHIDMETDYQMRMGLPEPEARRRARREFGGVERYRDESRDVRGVAPVEDFLRDLRVAARSLRRAPGFALVSVFTVALGIGATTAVYSIVDGILLCPLPYPRPHELVRIYERSQDYPNSSFGAANYFDMERATKTLGAVGYYAAGEETMLTSSQPVRVTAARVSERFFDVMSVPPAHGRGFRPGESRGDNRPVVISDRLWKQRLNGRPDWENRVLRLDGGTLRVVGIMPAGFSFPTGTDLWFPAHDDNPSRTTHNWSVIGRLRAGGSIAETQAELDQLFGGMKRQLGRDMDAEGVTIRTLREALTLRVKTLCYVLLAAVGLVLLVACTNLASANLARGESQQREIAVRTSLGASRGRLVRQLVTEKLLLCMAGGVAGIALSWAIVRAVGMLGAGTLPTFTTLTVDGRVLAFGLVMSLLTGLVTGVLPALRVTADLRHGFGTGGGSGKRASFRRPLIATEIAVATTLVIGAGLFLRSFGELMSESPGYAVQEIVVGDVTLPAEGYRNREGWYGDTIAMSRYFTEVLSRLRASPETRRVAMINQIPLGPNSFGTRVAVDGRAELTRDGIDYRVVDSAYFGVMGIPLIRGRTFTGGDRPGTAHVVVVNRATAEELWPGQNPIGHRIRPPGMDLHASVWLTVVGVVENVKQDGLDRPAPTQMYVHYLQRPERLQSGTFVVRSSAPGRVAPVIRAAAAEADRNSLVEITTMESLLERSVAGRRFSMTMLSAFSGLALFLAAVGIYGVLAYAVVQRQREIGVRMAIGLSRGGVVGLILGDAMRAVVPGLAIGLVGAYLATRFIQGMLYGIAPVDPVTYIVTPAVILGVALMASLWPASRASRVDPMIAMRAE